MNKKRFIDKIINSIKISLSMDVNELQKTCGLYNHVDFDNYWEDLLTKDQARDMESHCLDCVVCLRQMVRAFDLDEKTKVISETINYDNLYNRAAHLIESFSFSEEREALWAAAPDLEGGQGEAFGVAVSEDSISGALIECNAWVGNRQDRNRKFEIWGMQVEGTDSGRPVTGPLDYLEEKLKGIFIINPLLRTFHLNRRYISVDLKEKRFEEANSLALAIIMAIINGVLQRKEPYLIVYTADVRQDGKLENVGQIKQKLETAYKYGVKKVILSRENKKDCPSEFLELPDFKVQFFDNLVELFESLNIISTKELNDILIHKDLRTCVTDIGSEQQDTESSVEEEWSFLLKYTKILEIDITIMERLFSFFEDLCQARYVDGRFSTVFFLGILEKIQNILPSSGLNFIKKEHVFKSIENIQNLTALVNGIEMGFIVDTNGLLDSICKVNVDIIGRRSVNPFLMGTNNRYLHLSLLTKSMVFFFPPTGRHLHVFFNGKLVGKYLNGRWRETNYNILEQLLRKTSESHNLRWQSIKMATKSAVTMAERGLGATFFFLEDINKFSETWEDRLKADLGILLSPLSLDELTEEELINIAKEEGAVMIDHRGRIITCCAYFSARIERKPALSTRSQYACKFSKITGGLAIVASRYDGTITIFLNGEELICI